MFGTTRSRPHSSTASANPSLGPDSIPVLSRGKHRSARQGACFMEFASYLAGERWSDRPACTDPALASLARLVNDRTTDAERSHLAPLIPAVIGLRPEDAPTDLVLAARAAIAALPVASEARQRVLAIGLLRSRQRLAQIGREDPRLVESADAALATAPAAAAWARRHLAAIRVPRTRSDTPMCDAIVAVAVAGIAEACVIDPDGRLRSLLSDGIEECRRLADGGGSGVAAGREERADAALGAPGRASVLA